MANRELNGLAVTGTLTKDGNAVLDVGTLPSADATRIKDNPKITASDTSPSSPSVGDVWLDTSGS